MSLLRTIIYKIGFRPKLGSIFHSPSLHWFYVFKAFNVKAAFMEGYERGLSKRMPEDPR